MEVEERHEVILSNSLADADLNDLCYLDYTCLLDIKCSTLKINELKLRRLVRRDCNPSKSAQLPRWACVDESLPRNQTDRVIPSDLRWKVLHKPQRDQQISRH